MSNKIGKKGVDVVADQVKAVVGKAQEETGKLVNVLTREGEKLREQTLKLAEEAAEEVKERVNDVRDMVESAKGTADQTLDHLELLFEERVARALRRLGVPTHNDLQGIAQRLDAINDHIKALTNQPAMALPVPKPEKEPEPEPEKEPEKDDLQQINGIGPALAGKLNAAGICGFRQLATLSAADIARIETEVIHFSGRIGRDDWVSQAQALYAKKYGTPVSGE